MADIVEFPSRKVEAEKDHADMETLFRILQGKVGKIVIIAEFLDGNGFVGSYPHDIDQDDSQELYDLVSEVVFDAEPYN